MENILLCSAHTSWHIKRNVVETLLNPWREKGVSETVKDGTESP